jgi:uncharacterized protein (DUF1501 family)
MLDILGTSVSTDAVLSRRTFLRVGMLGMAGLTLPDLLRLRARAAEQGRQPNETAVIQVFLEGGPSHVDTFDPKPDAPAEYRGEFRPIAGNVAGLEVCELLPRMARVLDKVALLRSVHHSSADHGVGTHWIMTGFPGETSHRDNIRPSVGAIVARLRGANAPGVPPYVALPAAPAFAQGAYLGAVGNPFAPDGDLEGDARVRSLDPPPALTLDRLDDRRTLLARLDRLDRRRDASGVMEGMDRFTAEAYAMVTGPRARAAFDLSREEPQLRDRYGRTQVGQCCLLARRLVEAGVAFVTVVAGGWDHHGQIFAGCRRQLPPLDAALASLVEDLHDRGLNQRVLVLVWGEFGRTPRVNGQGGRDHWPGCMSVLLAGGGLRMGQAIGATGRRGEAPVDRGLRPEDVLRTVYEVLAIDPHHEFRSEAGRPLAVLNQGQPIAELLGQRT